MESEFFYKNFYTIHKDTTTLNNVNLEQLLDLFFHNKYLFVISITTKHTYVLSQEERSDKCIQYYNADSAGQTYNYILHSKTGTLYD